MWGVTVLLAVISTVEVTKCQRAMEVEVGFSVQCENAVLLPDDMASSLLLCREIDLPRCETKHEHTRKTLSARLELSQNELNVCMDTLGKTEGLLEDSLESREPKKWYDNKWFHVTVGVVVGVVTSLASSKM